MSDPHLGPMPRPKARELASKRAIGFINWHRGRKAIHTRPVLKTLMEDMKAQRPDHIAVTGDLVNIALPDEFTTALAFLDMLGPPERVTLVPGNHDLYVRRAAPHTQKHWGDFMRGDAGESFPFLRRRGPLALIGLSTAVPTPPFMATGRLGPDQLSRFAMLLDALKSEDLFRVVLLHHPPIRKLGDRFKRLIDATAFNDILHRYGAELILHGHDHVHSVGYLEGPGRKIPVVGVPSASAMGGQGDPAAYNLYRITRRTDGWHCAALTRGLRNGYEGIDDIAERDLT